MIALLCFFLTLFASEFSVHTTLQYLVHERGGPGFRYTHGSRDEEEKPSIGGIHQSLRDRLFLS
jgi:hypothetical protein